MSDTGPVTVDAARFDQVARYEALMDVVRHRMTNRAFRRWKKSLAQIVSWDRFDPSQHLTVEQIDAWIRTTRHKAMYRDETRVD